MPPKIQQTDGTPLLKNFLLQCMMLYYWKSSVETPATGFRQLIFNILCEDVHSVVGMPSSGRESPKL